MIISYIRTVLLYLVLIAVIRTMGKRQVGQMEPSEFVVTMLVANLASIPMQDGGIPLFSGLVPILTVLGMELVFSGLILRSIRFRKLLCGKPVILIDNGRIIQENLRATRVTLDELASHLRQKDVMDLKAVQYAILETDGNLSVFPYSKEAPPAARDMGIRVRDHDLPITIIEDGYFSRENLVKAHRDKKWMDRVLEEHRTDIAGTFLLTYTTSPIALTDGLEALLNPLKKLHLPVHELAMMMCIALRFIPTLIEETDKIMAAQKARVWSYEPLFSILVPVYRTPQAYLTEMIESVLNQTYGRI